MATVKRRKTTSTIQVEKVGRKAAADSERKAREGKIGPGRFVSFLDSAMAFSQKYDGLLEFELVRDRLDQWNDRVSIGVSIRRTIGKYRRVIEESGLATLPDTNSRLRDQFIIGIGSSVDLLSMVENELKSYRGVIIRKWLDACARNRILRKMSDEERRIMESATWVESITLDGVDDARRLIAYTLGAEDVSELEDDHDLVEDLEFTPDMLHDLHRLITERWTISPGKLEKSLARTVVQYEQVVEKLFLRT